MTAISDRYRRLSDDMTKKIDQVPPDKWSAPTPCPDWTATDLVRHLVEAPGLFFGMAGLEAPKVPPVEDDPAAAFAAVREAVQGALDDPASATKEYDGFAGKSTFEKGVDQFICTDLIVHGWDLSRAAGLDEHIDPKDLAAVRQAMAPMADKMRSPQAFGPEIDAPAGADDQTKLLAFLGRRA
jgi:uncharacterized protein (TIGR03086 family)